jgi:hypothetical protein
LNAPQAAPSTRFGDVPVEKLKEIIAILEPKCPQQVVRNPMALATEQERLGVAFNAGRHSIIEELTAACKLENRK